MTWRLPLFFWPAAGHTVVAGITQEPSQQFAPLVGEESLFQASARRLSGARYGAPVVMTNADFRFIVAEQLDQIGIDPAAIVIEPAGRNTAPAILAAALAAAERDPDAVLLVAPSDHVVPDAEDLAAPSILGWPPPRRGASRPWHHPHPLRKPVTAIWRPRARVRVR